MSLQTVSRETGTPSSGLPASTEGTPDATAEPDDALPLVRIAAGLVIASILIAGLYFARDLIVPLALAGLLGFVLDPIITRLRRWGIPRPAAVVAVVAATLVALLMAGMLLGQQLRTVSNQLPAFQNNIQYKLRDLRLRLDGPGLLDGAARTFEVLRREVEGTPAAEPSGKRGQAPVQRVQIQEDRPSTMEQAQTAIDAAIGPVASAGLVLVFLIMILLDRQALRDRLLRLLGGNLHRSTDAIDEAGQRISRYLTMQLAINLSYGVPMAAGLWLIGVPGALLWGALAAVMRFVPYAGPMIAAIFPLALAFAIDPGWSTLLWTLALIVALELLSNNLVEPWLYGASTGMSALSLMVSAIFWAAIWGPIGLVMATPLTVCLLVMGRHLPRLQFLDVVLGSEPALDAPTRLHQRLLAGDTEEAIEIATTHRDASGLADFYHQVGIPALRQACLGHDRLASVQHRHRIVTGFDRLISRLDQPSTAAPPAGPLKVLCIGGKWEIDAIAARMLAHSLRETGVAAEHAFPGLSDTQFFARLDLRQVSVCLSLFSPEPQHRVRQLCRGLRRRRPDVHIVLALWNSPPELLDEAACRALGGDAVVNTLEEALLYFGHHLGVPLGQGYLEAAIPPDDVERVRALRASGALEGRVLQQFELAARRAADIFEMPLALVTLIDEQTQHIGGASGAFTAAAGGPGASGPDFTLPRELSMCGHVLLSGEPMVVEDVARDPRFSGNPALRAKGVRFYAGVPLRDADGHVYGSLCVLDTRPRKLDARELKLLGAMADDVMAQVRLHRPVAADDGVERPGLEAAPVAV